MKAKEPEPPENPYYPSQTVNSNFSQEAPSSDEMLPPLPMPSLMQFASENSCDVSVVLDSKRTVLYISEAIQRITGWAPRDFMVRPYTELIHPEDRFLAARIFNEALRGVPSTGSEWRLACKQGHYVWFETRIRAVHGWNNHTVLLVASLRESTVRKNFESDLIKSEERYRSLIQNSPSGILIISDGNISFINNRGLRILGYDTPSEVLGASIEKFLPISHKSKFLEICNHILDTTDDIALHQAAFLTRGGNTAYTSVYLAPARWEGVNAVACYCRDKGKDFVSERFLKNMEKLHQALRESRETFFDWDILTGIVKGSPENAIIFGYPPDGEHIPNYTDWENHLHPDDKQRVLNDVRAHLEGETKYLETEYRLRNKDGKYNWIESRGRVTERDESGKAIRMLGTHLGISKKRSMKGEVESIINELKIAITERTAEVNEANTALRVILKQQERNRAEIEENLVTNIQTLLHPKIYKLKSTLLKNDQLALMNLIEKDLQSILSPFLKNVKNNYPGLTPKEIQIVSCIKNGKKSKEIAEDLNISVRTVDLIRYKIRKKLDINGKKINLENLLSNI